MPKQVASVICPSCEKKVVVYRAGKRYFVGIAGVGLGAIVGGGIGAGIGIATGGAAIAGTIPVGIIAGMILGGTGYFITDKFIDKPYCPSCKSRIDLGV